MSTGYKVMAYRLTKTDSNVHLRSMFVEDRQVDGSGELNLVLEDGMRRSDRSIRHTGFFHPGAEKQGRPNLTGVFHPSVVNGVAYVSPAEEVSTSQILDASDIPLLQDPMRMIDEVLVSVMKTEPHEMVFDDSPLPSDTHPSMRLGWEREPCVGHHKEDLDIRPNPRWLAAPTTETGEHPGMTQALHSTRRPVIIPQPSDQQSTARLRAWTQGAVTAVAVESVPEETQPESRTQPQQSPQQATSSPPQEVEIKAIEAEAEVDEFAAAHEPEQPWRDFSHQPTSLYQKLSIALLALILFVEVVRLLMGS